MIWLPDHKRLTFTLDPDRGRYRVETCPPGFTKVPSELIVEERQSDGIRHDANLILRGPNTQKEGEKRRLTFFTGLLPVPFCDVYDGDILTFNRESKRVKNYLLIRFSADATRLTLLYFPAFKPYPDKRREFVAEVIRRGLL